MRKLCIIIAGFALAGTLAACGSSSDNGYPSGFGDPSSSVETTTPTTDPAPAVDTSSNGITQAEADQLGEQICADLRNGMSQMQAWSVFQQAGLTPQQGANIMAAAIQDYCPDMTP